MHVDTDQMRSGADRSYQAADFAKDAVDALSQAGVGSGIFGSFAAADLFTRTLTESHSNHLAHLRSHQSGLVDVGVTAHRTASVFDEMEQRNAAALRSLP